jgi:hypothetical protein
MELTNLKVYPMNGMIKKKEQQKQKDKRREEENERRVETAQKLNVLL